MDDEFSRAIQEKSVRAAAESAKTAEQARIASQRAEAAVQSCANKFKSALSSILDMSVTVSPITMGYGRTGPVRSVEIEGSRSDFKVKVAAFVEWYPGDGYNIGRPLGDVTMTVTPRGEGSLAVGVPGQFNLDGTFVLSEDALRLNILNALKSS